MYSAPPPSCSVSWPAPQRFTVSTSNNSANASKSLALFSRTCLNLASSSSQMTICLRFPQYLRSRSFLATSWTATECPKLPMTLRTSPWSSWYSGLAAMLSSSQETKADFRDSWFLSPANFGIGTLVRIKTYQRSLVIGEWLPMMTAYIWHGIILNY